LTHLFLSSSLEEQQQIVKKLNSLSAKTKKLEAIYQKKLDNLEELKKSILDKAFKGGL
jgi:type I restriction enzyme S subunit